MATSFFFFVSFSFHLPALIRPFPSSFWVAGYLLFRLDARRPTSLSLSVPTCGNSYSRLTRPSFPFPSTICKSPSEILKSYWRIEATIVMQSKLMLCLARAGDGLFFCFVLFCFDTSYPIKRIASVSVYYTRWWSRYFFPSVSYHFFSFMNKI